MDHPVEREFSWVSSVSAHFASETLMALCSGLLFQGCVSNTLEDRASVSQGKVQPCLIFSTIKMSLSGAQGKHN